MPPAHRGWPPPVRLCMAAFLGVVLFGCSTRVREQSVVSNEDPMMEARTAWLDVINRLNRADFKRLNKFSDVPTPVYAQSMHWAGQMFRTDAGPHAAENAATHWFHLTGPGDFDLLRHEYKQRGFEVVVSESAVFTHVLCTGYRPEEFGGADPLAQAKKLADVLLNVPPDLQFELVPADPKYRAFSSARTIGPGHMREWTERIDGVVYPSGIGLLCYKAGDRAEMFANVTKWFPDDFRAKAGSP